MEKNEVILIYVEFERINDESISCLYLGGCSVKERFG